MKKILKTLLFSFMLISSFILVSCGEKKEELTGLHKEFDIIFNEVKEEGVSEFNANKEEIVKIAQRRWNMKAKIALIKGDGIGPEIVKEAKNSTRNEKEEKAMLNTYEIMFEAFKGSTYSVENINDMGDKAELQIKVKTVDFIKLTEELLENYKSKNNVSEEEFLMESMEEMLKKVKKGKVPMIEQEITVQMFKENDKWKINDNTKNVLMGKMFGSQKGTLFSF